MKFTIKKNMEKTWDIVPSSGVLAGRVIGTAEGINLTGARFFNDQVMGSIRSIWGLNILNEDVYEDPETIRGLNIGGSFKTQADDTITLDQEGFKDSFTLNLLKSAKHVMIIGSAIYGKGFE